MLPLICKYFTEHGGDYARLVIQHSLLSLIAIGLAVAVAVPLGYYCYRHERVRHYAVSFAQVLRIVPSLALLFLLIPIVGTGYFPALLALIVLGIPPILLNTILGFAEVPDLTNETAEALGMDGHQLLRRIQIPYALPYILAGIRLALIEIIASTSLAAYVGAGGLGTLIFTGLGLYRMDLLIIGGGSVAIMSLLMMLLFEFAIRQLSYGGNKL